MPEEHVKIPSAGLKLSASTKAYLKLGACAGLLAAGELLLKIGATANPAAPMKFALMERLRIAQPLQLSMRTRIRW